MTIFIYRDEADKGDGKPGIGVPGYRSVGEKARSSFKEIYAKGRDYPESILKNSCFNGVLFNRDKGDKGD
jgi:hypothetical protein